MQQQEENKAKSEKKELKDETSSFLDYIKNVYNLKDALIVVVLTVIMCLEPIDEVLKFKSVSLFYDIETDKPTFFSFLINKGIAGVGHIPIFTNFLPLAFIPFAIA